MNMFVNFLKNLFLAIGAIWFFCALAILTLNLNFGPREIVFTLILPLAYAIVRIFDKVEYTTVREVEEK
jgi:hypothetical protein